MSAVACAIIRGGTSKGIFVLERSLPVDPSERDRLLLALVGSSDARQIDGLGGGDPLTSKVAIVSPGRAEGVDLEYESVEVGIGSDFVNHGVMCGNLAAGVGLFALQEGLLPRGVPRRALGIHCRNNGKRIEARLADGAPWASADVHPGAVTIRLSFVDPVGAVTGRLLPLDEPVASLRVDGATLEFSAVDSGTLYAFVRAGDLGLAGDEAPAELDANQDFRRLMERVREEVMGRINAHLGTQHPPKRLKLAVVAAPRAASPDAAIVARIINPARVHKVYAVSGGICLASAATVPGSLVHEIVAAGSSPWTVGITHPSGGRDAPEERGPDHRLRGGSVRRRRPPPSSGTACGTCTSTRTSGPSGTTASTVTSRSRSGSARCAGPRSTSCSRPTTRARSCTTSAARGAACWAG